MKNRLLLSAILAVSMLFNAVFAADYLAPSRTNPGGFSSNEVPQLIVIGSDDNASASAMRWMTGELASRTNKDGSALRMSYYSNTAYWQGNSQLVEAHKEAYAAKHELANHTVDHPYCIEHETAWDPTTPVKKWWTTNDLVTQQIQPVMDALVSQIGVSLDEIYGFRTPFLGFSDNTFEAIYEVGIIYDCSIGEGGSAGNYYWPYTLDSEPPGLPNWWTSQPLHNVTLSTYEGLWELPAYNFVGPSGPIGGLDYNMWAATNSGGHALNKQQSIDALKNTLDAMYNGNRTPFTVGVHSQMYEGTESDFPNITAEADRKAVFTAFLDYAITFENAWFVSGAQAINYMRRPVRAADFNPDDYLPENFNNDGTTYTLTVENGSGDGDFIEGAVKTISADAAPSGKEFDKWIGDVDGVADVNSAITTITIGTANVTVTATYKDENTSGVILDDYANAYGDGDDQTYLGAAYGTSLYNQDSCFMGGGYYYVYADDSGSLITAGDGSTKIDDKNAAEMVENGALHAHIKTAASTEQYPYAAIEVPLIGEGDKYYDLSNMTALAVKAKGSGKINLSFTTKDVVDLGEGWGYYGVEITLGDNYETHVIPVSDLLPGSGSAADTSGWKWDHGKSEVSFFSINSVSGDAEVHIDEIVLRGMSYSDLFSGYTEPVETGITFNKANNSLPVSFSTFSKGGNTILKYNINKATKVDVKIFDLRGKLISKFSENRNIGVFQKSLNLSSGVYSVSIKTDSGVSKTMFTVAK